MPLKFKADNSLKQVITNVPNKGSLFRARMSPQNCLTHWDSKDFTAAQKR